MSMTSGVLKSSSRHQDWLPKVDVEALTVETVVQRLRDVSDIIAADAAETERIRHPTARVWSAIRKTGLFYLTVPKAFGGVGVKNLDPFMDPILTIAENCMSTAWCAMQSLLHQTMISKVPDKFKHEIWDEVPYLTSAGSAFPMGKAIKVDGGYRVSAHHHWGSGVLYAQWVFSVARTEDPEGNPKAYCFFMPVKDVTIVDSWYVDGLSGSGSHDFIVDDVFVPEHRILDAMALNTGQSAVVAVPILGGARAAVKAYRDQLMASGPEAGHTGRRPDHLCLAKAQSSLDIAEIAIRNAVARFNDHLARDTPLSEDLRVRLRAQGAFAAEMCKTAARSISDVSGSSVHVLGNHMQRAVRDVNMLTTHVGVEFSSSMDYYGRLLAGWPVEIRRRS